MGIIEPNFVGQNQNVIQEVHSAVALYWTHPEFGSFLIIWNLCELMELSVLYFSPGSNTQLEKFKYHPDRELRELALKLPGLMLQDLAPNLKSTIMLSSDGKCGRKAKAFLPFQQMQLVFVYT